jgi:hypothetical protein
MFTLISTSRSVAELQPSFDLEDCVWNATDIVIAAQEGRVGDSLTVLETWKGNQPKGTALNVAGLPTAPLQVPTISTGADASAVQTVTGDRIVLFLKPVGMPAATPATVPATRPSSATWVGADSRQGEARVSAVWIEGDKAYAFVQVKNPGPSTLVALDMTEAALKHRTQAILTAQGDLQNATAVRDPVQRARALEPLAKGPYWHARRSAWPALGGCGKPALPVLHEMLREYRYDPALMVPAIAAAAGDSAGPELTAILRDELAYWRNIGPYLDVHWRDDWKLRQRDLLWHHYFLLARLLRELGDLKYDRAGGVVTEVRAFWTSLPPLNNGARGDQILQECDRFLSVVHTPALPVPER